MPGTKPGIIYFESFIKKSLAEALTHRFQSASANEPSASRLCQSDGTLSQPAGRLAGMKNGDTVTAPSTAPLSPPRVSMSMLAKLTGQQPQSARRGQVKCAHSLIYIKM